MKCNSLASVVASPPTTDLVLAWVVPEIVMLATMMVPGAGEGDPMADLTKNAGVTILGFRISISPLGLMRWTIGPL
jgi:hypothetical protein